MKHSITRDGVAFRLRPVSVEDAEFLLELRTDPQLSRFLFATSPKLEDQIAWTEEYFTRENDWYWIVESLNGEREGSVAIYGHKSAAGTAEFGRWVLRHGSQAALESAFMAYDIAFEELGLERVFSRTETESEHVLSFLRSLGSIDDGFVDGPEGKYWLEQHIDRPDWPANRDRLLPLIRRTAEWASRS